LDQAFEALKTYDWGVDPKVLAPIDEAVISTHGNAGAREQLELRLAEVLKNGSSRDAKDYVCRKLLIIGTAASVPALAALLPQAETSHMARYALQGIPAPEAAEALRTALGKVDAPLKIGMVASLGARADADSVSSLGAILSGNDEKLAAAAAIALGEIGTAEAAKALSQVKPTGPEVNRAATDASLVCAEALLADGNKAEALAVYKSLVGENQPKHVRLAATKGMLACAAAK
jgi:HEAT repeat protein